MGCDTTKPQQLLRQTPVGEVVTPLGGRQDSNFYADKPRRRVNLDLTTVPTLGYTEVDFAGSVVWVNKAVGAAPEIEISFDDEGRDQAVFFQSNYFLRGRAFRKIRIYWAAQPASSMVLQLFNDKPDDAVGIL